MQWGAFSAVVDWSHSRLIAPPGWLASIESCIYPRCTRGLDCTTTATVHAGVGLRRSLLRSSVSSLTWTGAQINVWTTPLTIGEGARYTAADGSMRKRDVGRDTGEQY